jgi:hypothetical protein
LSFGGKILKGGKCEKNYLRVKIQLKLKSRKLNTVNAKGAKILTIRVHVE